MAASWIALGNIILISTKIVLAFVGIWILSIVGYRWHFHPLSKYPGPWFAKISDLYVAFQSLRGRSHLAVTAAHQRYGPVVRVGPNKLSFSTLTALHQIYYSRHVQKAESYRGTSTIRSGPPNTFNCVDKVHHRRKRKIVNQAFSEQVLRDIEPMVQKNVDIFIRELSNDSDKHAWSSPKNISDWTVYFTLDIIGEFGFGQSFNMLSKADNRYISDAVAGPATLVGAYYQYPGLASMKVAWLLQMLGDGTNLGSGPRFAALVKEMVVARMSQGKDAAHDLFSYLVDAKDPETGNGIPLDELWAEARLFLVAGSDTTASALAATFFYLSRYPKCYRKLTDEIRTTFSTGEEICNGAQLSQCQYLRACIYEAMRMSPPVPPPLWREVVAPEGMVIDGTWVGPGTNVGMSMYTMHHNEDVFPDSYTFEPERWLAENTSPSALEAMKKAYNPFSLGTRRCVAKPMAYLELNLALAKTLWYLDMKSPEGSLKHAGGGTRGALHGRHRLDEYQMYEHFISQHDGPYLQFQYRPDIGKIPN